MKSTSEASSPLTYLAAPYRHPSDSVMEARLEAVTRVAAGLTDATLRIFCPLTYANALLSKGFAWKTDAWWYEYDIGWLAHCAALVVLELPGWEESEGVRLEIEVANGLDIPISYLDTPSEFAGLTHEQSCNLIYRLS